MVYRHDYEKENEALLKKKPLQFEKVKWFRDIGWVAINTQMEAREKHIFFLRQKAVRMEALVIAMEIKMGFYFMHMESHY